MASSSPSNLKAALQLSPVVGDFSVDFSRRMRVLSSLLKRRRLTATYSFMKALALPRLVVKIRPLCSRGSANVVEEDVPDSDLIVPHVWAGLGLFSRSARNSSHKDRTKVTVLTKILTIQSIIVHNCLGGVAH